MAGEALALSALRRALPRVELLHGIAFEQGRNKLGRDLRAIRRAISALEEARADD